ncbi:MAG: flagellar biosynthesis anti-sigma factor FlgM [Pseudomonadota bacterium]
MKISNTTPNYINQTYTNQANAAANQNLKAPKPAEDKPTDSINLSSRTRDLQKISKAMETEPVDRQKLVADIKLQVQNDQYNINAVKVAEKIVGSLMDDLG